MKSLFHLLLFIFRGHREIWSPKQFILALKEILKSFLCPHQIGVGEKNEMKISFKVASLDEGLSFSKKFGKLFSQTFSL